MKQNVGEHLEPGNKPWDEVRDRLNQKLKGWKAYFGLGSTARAYRAIDEHVEERVRHFLRRRHKVLTRGEDAQPGLSADKQRARFCGAIHGRG